MQNQKIENLLNNYNNQNTKALIISILVCIILYFLFTEILKTKYLIWLLFIIFPLIMRIVIVTDFKRWSNKIARKENLSPNLIKEIARKNKIEQNQIFQSRKEKILSSIYFTVFLGITMWFFNENVQLKKYGVESTAKVYQINRNLKNSHALLEYKVDGKSYVTSIKIQIGNDSSDRIYYGKRNIKVKVGQKFKIIYSTKNPEINQIISEYPIE